MKKVEIFFIFFLPAPGYRGRMKSVLPLQGFFNQLFTGIFCGIIPDRLQKIAENVLQEPSRLEAQGNKVVSVDGQVRDPNRLILVNGCLNQAYQRVKLCYGGGIF